MTPEDAVLSALIEVLDYCERNYAYFGAEHDRSYKIVANAYKAISEANTKRVGDDT